MLVGEVYLFDMRRVVTTCGGDKLDLAHNFVFVKLLVGRRLPPGHRRVRRPGRRRQLAGWFLANHDTQRVASRVATDGQGPARARAVALMLYALRGTPFVFQGEELGLPDADIPPDRVVDVDGRDPERAPVPWQPPSVAGPGAGFTTGEPWLPIVAGAEDLCVARQDPDPRSTLQRPCVGWRRHAAGHAARPAGGAQATLDAGPHVLAWRREDGESRVLAAVNPA